MPNHFSRRSVLVGAVVAAITTRVRSAKTQSDGPEFSYPIGLPGRPLGDGFIVRHGYATENTWYNPGWWHTGEDWYATEGDAAGAGVFAVGAGEVVFVGSDYPGPVVIVRHTPDLYSMYGHLDYDVPVAVGQQVERGTALGTVLARTDGRAPSHLHFEVRNFLTVPEVNGDAPRYGVGCGFQCPPGPGYWPIDAPEHPSALGWRNPTHALARRAFGTGFIGRKAAVVAATSGEVALWSVPPRSHGARRLGELAPDAGDRYALLAVDAGLEATTGTSAEAYRLWYRIALPDGMPAWVQAAVPGGGDTGSDGRPSSVRFDFLPAVVAD